MRPMRRALVALMLSLSLGVAPLAAQTGPFMGLPESSGFDLLSFFAEAWSAVQAAVDKTVSTGDTGSSSTTQTTPTPGTGTTSGTPTDNGAGIDPNG